MTRSRLVQDKRATHYKDDSQISGKWFGEKYGAPGGSQLSVAWDMAYVFGPEATWEEQPSPTVAWGGTVVGMGEELMRAIAPLLSEE